MTFHMAYACGFLALAGLPLTGFAERKDVDELRQAQFLATKLSLSRELRIQTTAFCNSTDVQAKNAILWTIDRLREDYFTLTKQTYPEPRCS